MDRELLGATGVDRPRVVILPTAAAHESPRQAASNGVSYFSGLGCDASALMVVDSAGANDEVLVSRIDGADLVYLTGGSPHHLLEVFVRLAAVAAHSRGSEPRGGGGGLQRGRHGAGIVHAYGWVDACFGCRGWCGRAATP